MLVSRAGSALFTIVPILALLAPRWSTAPTVPKEDRWNAIDRNVTIDEYEIEASTFEEVTAACRAQGPEGWAGHTKWDLVWNYRYSEYDKSITVTGDRQHLEIYNITITLTEVRVDQTTSLPRLKMRAFSPGDKKKWKDWIEPLIEHERAHRRVSSTSEIGAWFERRVASVHHLDGWFPANEELTPERLQTFIRGEMTKIWEHARARITDKNAELDQMTGHQGADVDWKQFFVGYF